jgi:DNA-binding NarL/FixJ family response regulator
MRDRREKGHELHGFSSTHSAKTVINSEPDTRASQNPANSETDTGEHVTIVVIERRALVRECLTRSLKTESGYTVVSFATVDGWLDVCAHTSAALIVLCIAGKPNDPETHRQISRLSQQGNPPQTILVSDTEDPDQIVDAIGRGARGYIPTSEPLNVVLEVMRLVRAGGIFVPASSLMAARRLNDGDKAPQQSTNGLFTERQAAVVEALRRGKANKIIAYELNMRESTVKVHIRNIMKKLKARNRTEVALMANELMRNGGAV